MALSAASRSRHGARRATALLPGKPAGRLVCRLAALLACLILLGGCVYRLDVQQGNLLDDKDVAAIQPGMTRSQVRYLLGTPVSMDEFRSDRWDYMYYLRPGRSRKATQRWVVVWFKDDKVAAVSPNVPPGTNPERPAAAAGTPKSG